MLCLRLMLISKLQGDVFGTASNEEQGFSHFAFVLDS